MLNRLMEALAAEPIAVDGEKQAVEFEERLALLAKHWHIVKTTNEQFNLTAIKDDKEAATKHYWDCLYAAGFLPAGAKCLDIGSGAGYPGLVLAIMRPDTEWLLLDSLNKRCEFLKNTAFELGLDNVQVIHSRAEDAGHDINLREQFDIVTARAVTAMPVLAELTLPFLNCGGKLLALKGPALQEELDSAQNALKILKGKIKICEEYMLALDSDERTICIIEKTDKTSAKYPRKAGTPKKSPL